MGWGIGLRMLRQAGLTNLFTPGQKIVMILFILVDLNLAENLAGLSSVHCGAAIMKIHPLGLQLLRVMAPLYVF